MTKLWELFAEPVTVAAVTAVLFMFIFPWIGSNLPRPWKKEVFAQSMGNLPLPLRVVMGIGVFATMATSFVIDTLVKAANLPDAVEYAAQAIFWLSILCFVALAILGARLAARKSNPSNLANI